MQARGVRLNRFDGGEQVAQQQRAVVRRRPTSADIAAAAGVSKGAVSYALNGRRGTSEATRERILSVADALGWRPNMAARALSADRVGACGLVINRPARTLAMEPFFMEPISGIEIGLSARSVALLLQVVGSAEAEMDAHRRWWGEHRVDGTLLVDLRIGDPRIGCLVELGMPAVVIGEAAHAGPLPAVWNDDRRAVTEAVRYLVALGHRRLARVAGVPGFVHTDERGCAFSSALADAGASGHSVVTDYSGEDGARATRSLLLSADPPSAILYDNDVMAVAGLAVAHELGVDVPADLSLIAWDDSTLCQLVHPPLTAMSRDIEGHGRLAAERLLELIDGEEVDSVEVPTARLTPRGSTGAWRHR